MSDQKPKWGDRIPIKSVISSENPEVTFYYSSDLEAEKVKIINTLDINNFKKEAISYCWLNLLNDELGTPIRVPIMIARGKNDGPVLGLTAAIHGNELQGIPTIHTVFRELKDNLKSLNGTVIGVPGLNIPGFKRRQRYFSDGIDLNSIMPGNKYGTSSQQYAHYILEKIINKFDYLIDLHTASKGRVNSFYIRADLRNPLVRKMAMSFRPQILVNNSSRMTTLRGSASNMGIPSICVEIGDPLTFDDTFIKKAIKGIFNVMHILGLSDDKYSLPDDLKVNLPNPIICQRSYWIYTQHGGLLTIHPELGEIIKKDQIIASVVDIFGFVQAEYKAPEDGIVVGKADNPTNKQGDRILHLGIIWKDEGSEIPENMVEDND